MKDQTLLIDSFLEVKTLKQIEASLKAANFDANFQINDNSPSTDVRLYSEFQDKTPYHGRIRITDKIIHIEIANDKGYLEDFKLDPFQEDIDLLPAALLAFQYKLS